MLLAFYSNWAVCVVCFTVLAAFVLLAVTTFPWLHNASVVFSHKILHIWTTRVSKCCTCTDRLSRCCTEHACYCKHLMNKGSCTCTVAQCQASMHLGRDPQHTMHILSCLYVCASLYLFVLQVEVAGTSQSSLSPLCVFFWENNLRDENTSQYW